MTALLKPRPRPGGPVLGRKVATSLIDLLLSLDSTHRNQGRELARTLLGGQHTRLLRASLAIFHGERVIALEVMAEAAGVILRPRDLILEGFREETWSDLKSRGCPLLHDDLGIWNVKSVPELLKDCPTSPTVRRWKRHLTWLALKLDERKRGAS